MTNETKIAVPLDNILTYFRAWVRVCADGYAAARTYERLHALADVELKRRGLSRATLGAEILRRTEQRVHEDGR